MTVDASRQHSAADAPPALPLHAVYTFAGQPTDVVVYSFTKSGSVVIAWPDGSLSVEPPHRIRLRRDELS